MFETFGAHRGDRARHVAPLLRAIAHHDDAFQGERLRREGENPVPHYWAHVMWVFGAKDMDEFHDKAKGMTLEGVLDRIRVAGVLGKGGAVDAQKLSASDRDDILAKMRREVFHASDGVVKIEATSASMRLVVPSGRALTLAAGSFERGEGRVTARGRFSVACSAIGSDVVRGPMNAFRVKDEVVVLHASNLRPVKRVDLLLEAAARAKPERPFRLLVLAGESFSPFASHVRRLGLEGRVIVREKVVDMEEYLQAADVGLFTSESESFCLSILEAMCFGCPSVTTAVGGIPEVVDDGRTGLLAPFGDVAALARGLERLIDDPALRAALGDAGRTRAADRFSPAAIIPQYEALYRRVAAEAGRGAGGGC